MNGFLSEAEPRVKALGETGAAALYCAALVGLGVISAHLMPASGSCSDVRAFTQIQARTSLGASMPVPLIQMCAPQNAALLLMFGAVIASAAWALLMRWSQRTWIIIPCAVAALVSSLLFPYVATTDPYAYALYGFQTASGVNPYRQSERPVQTRSRALTELYAFFPPGSINRAANYGPVAVLQYRAIAALAGDSLQRFIFIARLLNAGLVLCLAWLLMLLRPPNTARISAGFVAFHPLILIESVAFAHGDILMLVLLCVALAAYRKGAIEICAAVIALAMEARVIAGLALLVLLMKAARDRDTRLLLRAGFASSATVVLTVLLSFAAYHTFTLGGSPSIEPYSSPLLLAFNAAGPTMAHVTLGGTLQALLGLAIVLPLMLAGRFSYVPLASLAILPMMRAWYCQWVIPQIAIEGPSKARYAAAMLAGVGIVSEWPEMTGHSDPVTWAIILSLQWLLPAAVLLGYAKRKGTLRLTAPNPATSAP